MKVTWLWPTVIIVSTFAAGLVTLVLPDLSIRPAVLMWFLFVCPGMALIRFLRLRDVIAEWTLALALSFTLDAIVATLLMYAGRWSPISTLCILMAISFCCATIQAIMCIATRSIQRI